LAEGMTAYLVQELERADNLTVRLRTEVATVHGQGDWSHSPSETEPPIHREAGGRRNVHHDRRRAPHRLVGRHLERDNRGFLLTGRDLLRGGRPPSNWPLDRPSLLLETSLPGVGAPATSATARSSASPGDLPIQQSVGTVTIGTGSCHKSAVL
jgi:thioredoxin reductase (NADPH)